MRKPLTESEKNLKQSKLLLVRVARKIKQKHALYIRCYGGSTTSRKAKKLYNLYMSSFNGYLKMEDFKYKFFLALLDTLYITNTYKKVQSHLMDRPFTIQNLYFSIYANVETDGFYPGCDISNNLGEIELTRCDISKDEKIFEITFEQLYAEFRNKIPDYLQETARQNLHCRFPNFRSVIERNNRVKLNEP